MKSRRLTMLLASLAGVVVVRGDEPLVFYEGDNFPQFSSPAWINDKACIPPCSGFIQDGMLNHQWSMVGPTVNYGRYIARPPEIAPATLWVEWRFRSNHPIGPIVR